MIKHLFQNTAVCAVIRNSRAQNTCKCVRRAVKGGCFLPFQLPELVETCPCAHVKRRQVTRCLAISTPQQKLQGACAEPFEPALIVRIVKNVFEQAIRMKDELDYTI